MNPTRTQPGDPERWPSTTVAVLHQNPYFRVLHQRVTVPDNTSRDHYTVHFPNPAVGIVPRRGSSVLLVRQYRFIVDEFVWAIPSGGVASGESMEGAARRELLEETGYSCGRVQPLMHCYASYGCSNQAFHIFTADDLTDTGTPYDGNEILDTRWFDEDELTRLILENGVVDNLSLSPLLLILLQRRLQA